MNEKNVILSPSLLSCDFAKIGDELKDIENCGVRFIHLDVMDGHFVPNISFGVPVIKSIRKSSSLVFDTHLMISNPEKYIKQFVDAGSDYVTFHVEADCDPKRTIDAIHSLGAKAGISVKPGTDAEAIFEYLPYVDLVLVMTVEPGFGGQSYMHGMLPKIAAIRRELDRIGSKALLSVDGGIGVGTAGITVEAGADMLVAGSAVFGKPDRKKACEDILNEIAERK